MAIAAMKDLLRGRVFGAIALASVMLPAIAISVPAIGRADPDCGPGFVWSRSLGQCVLWVPGANAPAGPVGPGGPGPTGGPVGPGAPGVPCPRR